MIDLYKKLYLIRSAEEAIAKHYFDDEMKTPMHMSLGSEAIVAGVCHALSKQDQVFGTYRSHATYLAKTMDTDKFFAEMYCKKSGCASGKAGSMHLSSVDDGMMVSSAIVASNIPVAVGCAYANKRKNNGVMTAVFFGEGSTDEGSFWESLNIACLMKLPILFICEDNELAVHTHKKNRRGYESLTKIISEFDCNLFSTNYSTDAHEIFSKAKVACEEARNNECPSFINAQYYRYLEHVGVKEDYHTGYRDKSEFDKEWYPKDPVTTYRRKLIDFGLVGEVEEMEQKIDKQIELSVAKAMADDFADKSELYKDVFCER